MKTYFHGPMGFAKTMTLRFRVGALDLSRRKKRCTGSREEEGVDAQICHYGKAMMRDTHIPGECETHKEEREVLKEMGKIDACDMEEFGTPDNSDKAIAILRDGWWLQAAKKEGDEIG